MKHVNSKEACTPDKSSQQKIQKDLNSDAVAKEVNGSATHDLNSSINSKERFSSMMIMSPTPGKTPSQKNLYNRSLENTKSQKKSVTKVCSNDQNLSERSKFSKTEISRKPDDKHTNTRIPITRKSFSSTNNKKPLSVETKKQQFDTEIKLSEKPTTPALLNKTPPTWEGITPNAGLNQTFYDKSFKNNCFSPNNQKPLETSSLHIASHGEESHGEEFVSKSAMYNFAPRHIHKALTTQSRRTNYTDMQEFQHHTESAISLNYISNRSSALRSNSRRRDFQYAVQNDEESFENITLDPSKYSQESVRRMAASAILRYLELKNYPDRLSLNEISKCHSVNVYQNIMDFLLKQLGPLPTYEQLKFEDRIPKVYKDLGYPGTLAKSHMISPCTLSTWPQHLVALTWLACLLYFDAKMLSKLCSFKISEPEELPHNACLELPLSNIRTPRSNANSKVFSLQNTEFASAFAQKITTPQTSLWYNRTQTLENLNVLQHNYTDEPESPTDAVVRTLQKGYIFYREKQGHLNQEDLNRTIEPALSRICKKLELEIKEATKRFEEASAELAAREEIVREICSKQIIIDRMHRDEMIMQDTIKSTELRYKQERHKAVNIVSLCEAKESKVTFLKREIDSTREILRNQKITKEELEPMIQKIETQKQKLQQKKQEKTLADKSVRELETQVTNLQDTLQSKTNWISQQLNHLDSSIFFSNSENLFAKKNNLTELNTELAPLPKPFSLDLTAFSYEKASGLKNNQQLDISPRTGVKKYSQAFLHQVETIISDFVRCSWVEWKKQLDAALKDKEAFLTTQKNRAHILRQTLENAEKTARGKSQMKIHLQDDLYNLQCDVETLKEKKKQLQQEYTEEMGTERRSATSNDSKGIELEKTYESLCIQLNKTRELFNQKENSLNELHEMRERKLSLLKNELMSHLIRSNTALENMVSELNDVLVPKLTEKQKILSNRIQFPGLLGKTQTFDCFSRDSTNTHLVNLKKKQTDLCDDYDDISQNHCSSVTELIKVD